MENNQGWIRLHRSIMETPEWLAEPFTRAQAWVDLLLIANHKTGFIRRRGIMVAVERGQVGHSEDTLAARWKWSRGKLRRFFAELTRLSRIVPKISEKTVLKKTSVSGLIYIINYDKYQGNSTEDGTEDGTGTRMKRNKISCEDSLAVLSYLNEKTGKRYRDTSFIEARLKDGGSVEDCKRIIDTKVNDPYFQENHRFLSPKTLFRPAHWDQYLNEALPLTAGSGSWFKAPRAEACNV